MNKKFIAAVSAMAISLTLLAGCNAYATGPAADNVPVASPAAAAPVTANSQSSIITEAQAKMIARENAGLAEADVRYVWVELLQNGASQEYKVEFLTADGTKEYDYHIDATTGEIMSMDREAEKYRANGVQQTQTGATQNAPAQTPVPAQTQAPAAQQPVQTPAAPQAGAAAQNQYIGEASAKQIALSHAGIAEADANFVRCFLDFDNGRWEYEVEFYSGATEYDYDIDAYTGDIFSFDYDAEYYTPGQNLGNTVMNGTSITAEQAKQIALNHAGVAESDARRMEMDFDYEWGRAVYEFEWKVGWMEYSVDVDANTGEVVGYEQEWD